MAPTTFLTKIHSNNTISPNIDLSDFPILESTQTIQDTTTSPSNATVVSWDTLAHQQLNMNPIIATLKIQY